MTACEPMSLQYVADMLNKYVTNGLTFKVEETYEDYGAGLKWENIIVYGDWIEYQLLNPAEMTILNEGSLEDKINLVLSLIDKMDSKKINQGGK